MRTTIEERAKNVKRRGLVQIIKDILVFKFKVEFKNPNITTSDYVIDGESIKEVVEYLLDSGTILPGPNIVSDGE